MAPIATYVFIDLETTGLPKDENNLTKITELSLVAVKRIHLLDTRPGAAPRLQHKLTLCVNPGRVIMPSCSDVTGLCNDLLEHETPFNLDVYNLINNFLSILQKPVCLIAQNGLSFDYPILKNHIEKLKVSLPDDLLCADCFYAFYEILENIKKANLPENQDTSKVIEINLRTDKKEGKEENGASKLETIDNEPQTSIPAGIDEVDLLAPNTLAMKLQNERTPTQRTKPCANTPNKDRNKISKARRKFPWSEGSKPTESYRLKYIYERLLNRPAIDAHRAENDCMLALECSVVLAKDFVKWVDQNNIPFADIKPMTVGVPIGS